MFGVMQHLKVIMCPNPEEAAAGGHTYDKTFTPLEIDRVVVVQKGTESGGSTVDIVLKDKQGKQYVVFVTGRLMKSIPL